MRCFQPECPINSFKPYYNWITFNTNENQEFLALVILGFKPYYNWITFNTKPGTIITWVDGSFKPYYNWITFNTLNVKMLLQFHQMSFKPYYNWITFNTELMLRPYRTVTVLNLIITG